MTEQEQIAYLMEQFSIDEQTARDVRIFMGVWLAEHKSTGNAAAARAAAWMWALSEGGTQNA